LEYNFGAVDIILIIRKCLAGDEDAWNTLHREYSGIAMAFLRWKFPDFIDDHDDIIQKVFSNLLATGLRNFTGTTKYEFLAYFKTIVKNEALDCAEEKQRKKTISLYNDKFENEDDPPMLEIPDPNGGSQPDRKAEAREMLSCIEIVMRDYPVVDQQVFLMKIQGHMDREIAAMLKMPIGTVAVKYSRIRETLREKCYDKS
jgi:RNA polymerase sigma factor (sigma-70 family)